MSLLKSIGNLVAKSAPILGGVIGGPLGAGAVKLLAAKLGVDPQDHNTILKVLNDPATAIKLQELENAHEQELARLALRETEMGIEDRQNARAREVSVTQATGKRDLNLYILAWVIVGGFFVMTGLLYYHEIPSGSIGPVNQLFGALTLAFGGVVQYFFGSSRGSAEKTAIMAEQAKKTNGGSD